VADPGLRVVTPGSGAITVEPVSDCHQVSITGARPAPTCWWNQAHASGLIDSPTVPSSRTDDRSCSGGGPSGNQVMKVRMSVGAV
jgi:hypothetical protein